MTDRTPANPSLKIDFDPGRTIASLRQAEAIRADILRRGLLALLASPGAGLDAAIGALRRSVFGIGVRLRQG